MKFFVPLLFSVRIARIIKPLAAMSLIVLSLIIASSSLTVQANADLDTQEMSPMSAGSSSLSDDAFIEMNVGRTATSRANRIARGGAQVIYVNANATGANNGTSWENAYTGLQNALTAAGNGAEIWVAAGTYKPASSTLRTASFSMKNGVALYGGFNGSETTREQRDWNANPTILSGDLNGNDNDNVDPNEPTRADNSHHVVMSNGVNSTALLDGFIISGGNASDDGGGMYNSSNSRVTISNVTFTRNSASGNGGGMVNFNSSPTISNVMFNNNSAGTSGGGMTNGSNSSPTISNVTFSNNFASGDGGGMFNYTNSNPIISQSAFRGNEAKSAGGAMANSNNSSPEISNTLFSGNLATLGGGAILNLNSNLTVSNVTFSGNRASYGSVMANDNSSGPTIINSILWNNQDDSGIGTSPPIVGGTPTVTYSLVQGGWDGERNIDADPLFVTPLNPNNAPSAGGDFHLSSNSPAIDAGSNSGVSPGAVDLDGNERISGGTVDMGAYEFGTVGGPRTETEPNNSCQQANPITEDLLYTGTLEAQGDEDFFSIDVTNLFDNLIINLNEPIEDYKVELFYAGCSEDRVRNIGFVHNFGEERLVYNVGRETGTYYIKVSTDGQTSSNPYTLQVKIEPNNPDTVKTLILLNRSKLQTIYGLERTSKLLDKLNALENHPAVAGRIIEVDQNAQVQAAYNAWDANPSSAQRANDVTAAIKNYLTSQHDPLPLMEQNGYLVIVGDDRVIPFHRVHVYKYFRENDPDWRAEREYATRHLHSGQRNTISSALFDNQTLTDDFYADFTPTPWRPDHDLYIPDLATGRLVEEPEEMMAVIDAFLDANGQVDLNHGAVSSDDFVQDAARNQYNILSADGLTIDNSLIGGQFSGNDLIETMLQPSNDVCAINGHSSHYQQGAPDSTAMLSIDVSNASGDFSGNLFFTVGCQSGLNVPPSESNPLDFPQAFARRGVTYVGNTGWAYGMESSIGLTEKLIGLFTENLVNGNSASIGLALTKAKHDYWLRDMDQNGNENNRNYYDEKIMIEATLFGLPMLHVKTPTNSNLSEQKTSTLEAETETLRVNPEIAASPGPLLMQERGWKVDASLSEGVTVVRKGYDFPSAISHQTENGTYYTTSGLVDSNVFEPLQPMEWDKLENSVARTQDMFAHGVLMLSGKYGDKRNFDPVIDSPIDLNSDQDSRKAGPEPEFSAENFYPALPCQFNKIVTLGDQRKQMLVLTPGQYDSQTQTERLFDNMTVDVYYSNSNDETAPTISTLSQAEQGNQVRVSVPVTDNIGVQRVVVTYTTGPRDDGLGNFSGEWLSVELTLNGNNTWSGTIPAGNNTSFFIQAVDTAGNVAVDDNNGRYFTAGTSPTESIYLPLVIR